MRSIFENEDKRAIALLCSEKLGYDVQPEQVSVKPHFFRKKSDVPDNGPTVMYFGDITLMINQGDYLSVLMDNWELRMDYPLNSPTAPFYQLKDQFFRDFYFESETQNWALFHGWKVTIL